MEAYVYLVLLFITCRLSESDVITDHRAKRSDDPAPLETVVMQLSAEVNQLKAQMAAVQDKQEAQHRHSAFLAQLATNFDTLSRHAPFKFNKVLVNDAGAYDATLGVYTAPYSGVYVFAVQIFTNTGENPLVDIRVNGGILTRMSTDTRNISDPAESISTSVVTKLNAGDRVWVQADNEGTYWGTVHTFFTGALLYTTE